MCIVHGFEFTYNIIKGRNNIFIPGNNFITKQNANQFLHCQDLLDL